MDILLSGNEGLVNDYLDLLILTIECHFEGFEIQVFIVVVHNYWNLSFNHFNVLHLYILQFDIVPVLASIHSFRAQDGIFNFEGLADLGELV